MDDDVTLIPEGLYDLLVLSVDLRESRTGRWFYHVHMQVEGEPYDGFELYAYLLAPEQSDKAAFVWQEAVAHPLDLIIDDKVMGDIGIDVYQDQQRNRVRKLMPRV